MATIDEDLAQMEKDIRQLKIEYDMFFGGGRKRPPTEIEWRIDQMNRRYSERGGELKFGQRFRFSNLSQTYAKYKDMFRKRLALKEEGKVQRHFGAAAKAIEAERARTSQEPRKKAHRRIMPRLQSRFAWFAPNPKKKPKRWINSTKPSCRQNKPPEKRRLS